MKALQTVGWVSIAIKAVIGVPLFFLGLAFMGNGGWFFIIISLFFFLSIYRTYRKVSAQNSNTNYYNKSNDGIYKHYLKYGSEEYGITIDTNKRTIDLISGSKKGTFQFDQIKSWSYEIQGATHTTAQAVGRASADISNSIGALGANNIAAAKAWRDNGFFIKTSDIENSSWHIKFFSEDSAAHFRSDYFWKNVTSQCETWMNVMERVINNN